MPVRAPAHRGRPALTAERILAAAKDGDADAVRKLLARDPSLVGAVDVHRKTPLHLAAEHDHAEVAELLLDAGAELEAWTAWGATPLEWAGVLGSRRAGDVLLAHGARLTLATAAGLGLMDALPRLYREDGAVSPAFVLACRNGHTDAARFLLDRGADVDARGFLGATGLHWAAHNGHADAVRFLLAAGADPTLHDTRFDSDALGWAREGGHEPVVALLMQ
jgi:ankyrin repeat protein